MERPKWFTLANITRGPSDPSLIEIVDLQEKVKPCFMIEEYVYKLIIIKGGKRTVTHFNSVSPITLQEYEQLVKKALGGHTLSDMVKKGCRVQLHYEFLVSKARTRILNEVKRPKKERRYS